MASLVNLDSKNLDVEKLGVDCIKEQQKINLEKSSGETAIIPEDHAQIMLAGVGFGRASFAFECKHLTVTIRCAFGRNYIASEFSLQAMQMLQLSGVLEMQSLRLKRDALKLMNATVCGTATSAMWSVLENYFGIEEDVEEKELEEAQSLAEMLRIQRGEAKEDVPALTKQQADSEEAALAEEADDAADTESVASSTTSSTVGVGAKRKTLTALKKKAMDDYPTKCSISEAKVFYPTSSESMHSTGVDSSLICERQSLPGYRGFYECNVGDCTYVSHTHGVCTTHVRRCHLGYAVGCRFCPQKRWWQARTWSEHMDKYHSDVPKFEVLEMPTGVVKAEEIEPELFIEKEKFVIPAPGGQLPSTQDTATYEAPPKRKRPLTKEQEDLVAEGAEVLLADPPTEREDEKPDVVAMRGQQSMDLHGFVATDIEEDMQ